MVNRLSRAIVLAVAAAVAVLALAGCGGGGASEASAGVEETTPATDAVTANELALGTLYLEDTDLAVTQEQAQKLLPLWQMLNALYSSDTAARDEIAAVVTQLHRTMTAEQMAAIRAIGTSPEDMAELMESLGLDFTPRLSANGTPSARRFESGFQGQPPAGFEGGQGRFGGGAIPGAQPSFSEADIAAMRATREAGRGAAERMMGGRVNTVVMERLIEVLQARAAG